MQTFNGELCHCKACKEDYELLSELPPTVSINNVLMIAETITDVQESMATLNMICSFMNKNFNLPYFSWEMGWCIQEMIRVLRRMAEAHGTDKVFSQYSKLIRNV